MNFSGLSLHQAPPFHTVVRYFFVVPVALVCAAVFLYFEGEQVLLSVHSSQLIVFIHLITLGAITMAMLGAIGQMLPVVAGVVIPRPVVVSNIVFPLYLLGVVVFLVFYTRGRFEIAIWGVFLTGVVLLFYAILVLYHLLPVKNRSASVWGITLSLVSLVAVVVLANLIFLGKTKGIYISWASVPVHAAWAMAGWVFLLIVGVSYQVVPMFYVTPEISPLMKKNLVPGVFLLLVIFTLVSGIPQAGSIIGKLIPALISLLTSAFACVTLVLIKRRSRKLPDYSLYFWVAGLISLFLASVMFLLYLFFNLELLLMLSGAVYIFGFVLSLVTGMIYKIVPFLSWFHLSTRGIMEIPTMKELIKDRFIYYHFISYCIFLLFLVLALAFKDGFPFIRVAGMFLLISGVLLSGNLFHALRIYVERKKLYNR